jgi:hypothetical protein
MNQGPWTVILQHGEGGRLEHIGTSPHQPVAFRMAEEVLVRLKALNQHHNVQAFILDKDSTNNPPFDLSRMPMQSKGIIVPKEGKA